MPFYSQEFNPKSFLVATRGKDFRLTQEVSHYIDYAKTQRDLDSQAHPKRQYRSYAIIPDIVAIDILTKHGLDIHSPDFLKNPADVRRLEHLIETEYPKLKTSNIKAS